MGGRVSREQRGSAADGAGLRCVRVEDVWPMVLDETGETVCGTEVVERRDLAVEIGQLDDLDAPLLGDVRHRSSPRASEPATSVVS